MPAVARGNVLVTGANGFIAFWAVAYLLEHGYSVRGTVRTAKKGEHLREIFGRYDNKLELVVVADITKPGIFDEAVQGVDAVMHIASPVVMTSTNPDAIITPAVQGTTNIFLSVLAYGTSVRRIILISSCGAVFTIQPDPPVFTPRSWNDTAVADVSENGQKSNVGSAYMASKVLAERAAWALYEENKARILWDLVVFCGPLIIGPALHDASIPSELGFSQEMMFHALCVPPEERIALTSVGLGWLDVRDFVEANMLALAKEEAGGERFIISAGPFTWGEFADEARKFTDDIPATDSTYPDINPMFEYDMENTQRVLGLRFRSKEDCIRDILADFSKKGLWQGHFRAGGL